MSFTKCNITRSRLPLVNDDTANRLSGNIHAAVALMHLWDFAVLIDFQANLLERQWASVFTIYVRRIQNYHCERFKISWANIFPIIICVERSISIDDNSENKKSFIQHFAYVALRTQLQYTNNIGLRMHGSCQKQCVFFPIRILCHQTKCIPST